MGRARNAIVRLAIVRLATVRLATVSLASVRPATVRLAIVSLAVAALTTTSATAAAPRTGTDPITAAVPRQAAPAGAIEISVMTQNIFYGGDDYDLDTGEFCAVADGCPKALHRLARIIDRSGADVVGIQEPERNVERLANILGWHGSNRSHIVSRYPIVDPPRSGGLYVFVEPSPGKVVAVANVHLPSTPYGPYEVRDGANRDELRALERTTRLPWIREQLRVLPKLADQGIPVVLTGDFNSPSHLDWTQHVAAVRPDVPFSFRWPVSAALAKAGFVDSYREAHPDPVQTPGFTWTPGGPETDPQEVFDRIDWVLHAGPATTIESLLIGENGGPDVDLGVPAPYPSDHRGVVSTLSVVPAKSPVLVSVSERDPTIGDRLKVTFHAPGQAGERIAIARGNDDAGYQVLVSKPTGPGSPANGSVRLATRALNESRYDVVLLAKGGRVLSQTPIWAYSQGTKPTIIAGRERYDIGDSIKLSWTHSAGMGLDWVSLFPCTKDRCAGNGGYTLYDYTHSRIEGSLRIGPADAGLEGGPSWPLPAGVYVARLLIDDSYTAIAQSPRIRIGKP
jgi:endonuclease/exonuclease/phosphatase family metal-dependent hydrolase